MKFVNPFSPRTLPTRQSGLFRTLKAGRRNATILPTHQRKSPTIFFSSLRKILISGWHTMSPKPETIKASRIHPKLCISFLVGFLDMLKRSNPDCPNFMDRHNPAFRRLWISINNVCRSLRADGIGAESKHTAVITKEEENKLWETRALGLKSPKSLLRTVFFTVGKFVVCEVVKNTGSWPFLNFKGSQSLTSTYTLKTHQRIAAQEVFHNCVLKTRK